MPKWEYKTVELTQSDSPAPVRWSIPLPEGSHEPEMLEAVGDDGWELAAITEFSQNSAEGALETHVVYYFKRPKGAQLL